MANIRVKQISPELFIPTQDLIQASAKISVKNNNNIHNLVEGDIWTIYIPALGIQPVVTYSFYFGETAPAGHIKIQVAGKTATEVAESIRSYFPSISSPERSYLKSQNEPSTDASFTLYAGSYLIGSYGNRVLAPTLFGKIENERGSFLDGGQDCNHTCPGLFDYSTFGIQFNPVFINSRGIGPNSTNVSSAWGLLDRDASFNSTYCDLSVWNAFGWGVGGLGYNLPQYPERPDFEVSRNYYGTYNNCLSSLKGFIIQSLSNPSGSQNLNPYNWDFNLLFAEINYKDKNSVLGDSGTTCLIAMAYSGNQNEIIDGTRLNLPGSASSLTVQKTNGSNTTVTVARNTVFDTIPSSNSYFGLPLTADIFLGSDSPPSIGGDIGLLKWPNPTSSGLLRCSSFGTNGFSPNKLIYQKDNLIHSVRTEGDFFYRNDISFNGDNSFLIHFSITVGSTPSDTNVIVDFGRNDLAQTGVSLSVDLNGVLHFNCGIKKVSIILPVGEMLCVSAVKAQNIMVLFVNSLTSSFWERAIEPCNTTGTNGITGLSLLSDRNKLYLADNVSLHGFAMYLSSSKDQFSLSESSNGKGVFLPTVIHQFWINYMVSTGAYGIYNGSVPPSPLYFS